MLKSVEDISATKKRVSIEIPEDIIENEIKSSYEKLRQNVKIPGFRAGKVPMNLLEKRFAKEVEAEVIEKIVPEHYNMALRQANLSPVGMPELEEKFEFKRDAPLTMTFVIEVLPKLDALNYENLTVKDLPFSVEDSDIDVTIKRLQDQKVVYEVADKVVEMDDFVSFEYADSEIAGGENNPSLKEQISKMGNEILPQDVMEKVLGKGKGDIIEFTKIFDETGPKELAGKTVNIKISISEVKKKNRPALDDEFAKDIGFENIANLREKLKEKIQAAKKGQIQKIQKAEIINKIIKSNDFEVPESLVNRELEAIIMEKSAAESKEDTLHTDPMTAIMETASDTMATADQKDEPEDPQAKLKRQAMRNVQASIIIDTIGKKEGITVTDSEVDNRISLVAKKLSATPEVIKNFYMYKQGSLDSLRHSLYEEKVLDMLLSKATVEKGE